MAKNHTLICKTEEDRLRYIRRHDLFPEMLEALKQTTSWLEAIYKQGLINPRSSVPDWIQKGNDAIIKAEKEA